MMKQCLRKFLALLLVITFISGAMAGCFWRIELPETDPESPTGDGRPPDTLDIGIPCDGRISISFVPEDVLNPYTSTSRDNLAVAGLVYEGLFAMGENFTAIPAIAVGLSTLDGRLYTLEIRQDITFHSGEALTVEDVIYSLNWARQSALFAGRLSIVSGFERHYDEDGVALPYEMDILLNRVHGNIGILLTFPIIQRGSVGYEAPPGSGPYQFTDENGPPRLVAFPGHRYGQYLPLDTIYLTEIITMEQMTAHFNSGLLDIVGLEITVTGEPLLAPTRELRHFEASLMDYVGFNLLRPEMRRAEVRQAISLAIDRVYITENIMRGNAVPSTLPFHPALFYYDGQLAAEFDFDLRFAQEILAGRAALDRPDERPTLADEYPAEPAPTPNDPAEADEEDEDEEEPTQLTLLVASGNTNRMEVAVYIAASISELGYQVIIDDRPYHEFLQALAAGNFDLYYGQVRLQPDFDLWELLFGSLNFSGVDNIVDRRLLDDFLASGLSDRGLRAELLSRAIMMEAPFAVIGFRNLSVATQRGVVIGMQPTQENMYNNVWEWIVELRG